MNVHFSQFTSKLKLSLNPGWKMRFFVCAHLVNWAMNFVLRKASASQLKLRFIIILERAPIHTILMVFALGWGRCMNKIPKIYSVKSDSILFNPYNINYSIHWWAPALCIVDGEKGLIWKYTWLKCCCCCRRRRHH